jgi:hypothetical protein
MPSTSDKGSPIEATPSSLASDADKAEGRAGVLRRVRGAALPLAIRGVPPRRKKIALAVAAAADLVQLVFLPMFVEGVVSPFQDALDIATAVVLVAVLGFHWRLALAFAAELIPGADLFPTWVAVVASLPAAAPEGPDPR